MAVNEPPCLIINYHQPLTYLMETFKRYIFAYFDFPEVNQDLRLMVASLIWDYMHPLLI